MIWEEGTASVVKMRPSMSLNSTSNTPGASGSTGIRTRRRRGLGSGSSLPSATTAKGLIFSLPASLPVRSDRSGGEQYLLRAGRFTCTGASPPRESFLAWISHDTLEMRNLSTFFAGPERSFSPYPVEDRLVGRRSEALECVQLAAAFPLASLLAKVRIIASIFLRFTCAHSSQGACENPNSRFVFPNRFPASKLAGSKSGSELHALQSFAPNMVKPRSTVCFHGDLELDSLPRCATGLTAPSIVSTTLECTA